MTLIEQTDAQIYTALKQGDMAALGILYERYGEIVYRLALRMLGNPEEAEDLTQEVFLTFWRRQTYDPRRGSVLTFLNTLTRSQAIDRYRQGEARGRLKQRWQSLDALRYKSDSLEKLAYQEMATQVGEALAQLNEMQRTVLEMAYFDGLSQSEIASSLKIPLGTVKTHKRNALLKLRQLLDRVV